MLKPFTVPGLADLLGVSTTLIYSQIRDGEIPTIPHLGHRKLIPGDFVQRMLSSSTPAPSLHDGAEVPPEALHASLPQGVTSS